MEEAIFNSEPAIAVGTEWLARLKRRAAAAPRGRFRLCLHGEHQDPLQEMIIVLHRDANVPAHRGTGKPKSYCVIEGEMEVRLFDAQGRVTERVALGDTRSGKPWLYRFSSDVWHTVAPLSDPVVYVETTPGPFEPVEWLEERGS